MGGKEKDPEARKRVVELSDGVKTSREIAEVIGCTPRYVRGIQERLNLPRSKKAPPGELSKNWRGGRKIDRDGYILVTAPLGHPTARKAGKGRLRGQILEHRLVMEQILGRHLESGEVVDHIDGNKMNNAPENLRLFSSNAEHLSATLKGKCPEWSDAGRQKLQALSRKGSIGFRKQDQERIDTYNQRKKSGDVRRQQILLARERLGKDHPAVSGAERFLVETQTSHQEDEKDIEQAT